MPVLERFQQMPALGRYAFALAIAAFAILLRLAFGPLLHDHYPFVFAHPAVLVVGVFAGFWPGLLCMLVVTPLSAILFIDPDPDLLRVEATGILSNLLMQTLILVLASLQRGARVEAAQARDQVQEHAGRLEREVSGHRRTSEALKQSEEKLRLLVESAVDYAIFTMNLEGRITTWNVGAERMFGYTEEEALGKHGRLIFTPEDRQHRQAEIELKLAAEHGRAADERWHVRKDGKMLWGSGTMMPLQDDGHIHGFVKILRDDTARREAETALRDSEERYRLLTELNPDAVIVHVDEKIVFANEAAQKVMGGDSLDALKGRSIYDFLHSDCHESVRKTTGQMLKSGKARERADCRMVRSDGTEFEAETVAAPVPWKGSTGIQIILHDITERKQHEESLRKANDVQRLLLRELDHRVRNNLASLISLIEISAGGKTNVREVAEAIRSRTQAMAAVHQLLSKQHWTTVNLPNLIDALRPPGVLGTVRTRGPNVAIAARQVTAMGMVLQELFRNSAKYGSLSVRQGEVDVQWNLRESPEERLLELQWIERKGPEPESDPAPGVGTGLIRGFVRSELRGEVLLDYPAEGATHRFSLRLDPLPKLAEMVA